MIEPTPDDDAAPPAEQPAEQAADQPAVAESSVAEPTVAEPDRPRPSPGPRHAAPAADDEHRGRPRRWFLAGAGAAVLAAAGGTGVALLRNQPAPAPKPAPAALLAAIGAETALIADLDATTGGAAGVRQVLVRARADHAAHLQALQALAAGYDEPATSAASSTPARGTARTREQLRAAERQAAQDAAGRAATLDGRTATLLASIAACEASHAELLA